MWVVCLWVGGSEWVALGERTPVPHEVGYFALDDRERHRATGAPGGAEVVSAFQWACPDLLALPVHFPWAPLESGLPCLQKGSL